MPLKFIDHLLSLAPYKKAWRNEDAEVVG
jgi:hypothetical protein